MFPRTFAALVGMALVSSAAFADVIQVDAFGGGDFLTVQAAIDAAQDGDVIVVAGTSVQPAFSIDGKAVEVIADTPGLVLIAGGNIRIENLAPGQSVTIANFASHGDPLDCLPGGESLGRHGLVVRQALGPVRVINCSFEGATSPVVLDEDTSPLTDYIPDGGSGAVVTATDIAFVNCQLLGGMSADLSGDMLTVGTCYCLTPYHSGGDGLRALNSNVSLYNTVLAGGAGRDGEDTGASGGHGMILLSSGSLFASGCDFQGAPGGNATDYIWSTGGDGGHGVSSPQAADNRFLDCTYAGAPGGYGFSGPDGDDGEPRNVTNAVDLPGTAHRLSFPGPVYEQQLADFTLDGHAGDQAYVIYGVGEGSLYVPDFSGQLHVAVPWLNVLWVGSLPASGSLQISVAVPELGLGIEGLSLRMQPLFAHGLGGSVVLGNWAPLLMLDDGL